MDRALSMAIAAAGSFVGLLIATGSPVDGLTPLLLALGAVLALRLPRPGACAAPPQQGKARGADPV